MTEAESATPAIGREQVYGAEARLVDFRPAPPDRPTTDEALREDKPATDQTQADKQNGGAPSLPRASGENPSEEDAGVEAGEAALPPLRKRRRRGKRGGRRRRGTIEAPAAEGLASRAEAAGSAASAASTSELKAPSSEELRRTIPNGASDGTKAGLVEVSSLDVRASQSPKTSYSTDKPSSSRRRRRGEDKPQLAQGRYLMCVQVRPEATQIAILEGRRLIEHWVARPNDDANAIDGNIYLGRVQNVLPGMEAAFVDIGTAKNAVLYRGDLRYDPEELDAEETGNARIEQILRPGQRIVCQVVKNPIGNKGARLTQEVSLPGRYLVLIPNSSTYGISKRLPDDERRRLRRILDQIRPAGHGLIVRTAAQGAFATELKADVERLTSIWASIEEAASKLEPPAPLYKEPGLPLRIVREELDSSYRGVIIDDYDLWREILDYVRQIMPDLADRIIYYDRSKEPLPIFERYHVHEQLHKALDRKVWLPSGGSLIIERTEALTVIDVNTGKNVGSRNLEETVFANNLEAADEIARQLRLRDIGGIIVIDFIDMELPENRNRVIAAFRAALARDKTRTQVFDISELGLVQMTRKRVSEGLVESFSATCPTCNGRGIVFDERMLS